MACLLLNVESVSVACGVKTKFAKASGLKWLTYRLEAL